MRYESDGAIATVTIDDGKVNVLSPEVLSALDGALDRAEDDGVAVLLAGRPGVFSAGFHLPTLTGGGEPAVDMVLTGFRLAERLLSFPAPVVIACTGHALAMGAFLLLAGDARVGALGAYRIGVNEVAIGLVMPDFGVEMARQRLTPPSFHRAVVNAEIFDPEAAVAAGFLDRAVPRDELMAAAHATVAELAQHDRKVHTVTKRRARARALQAVRVAIEADEVALRASLGRR